MDFGAWAARAGVAHHPKVVLLAAGADVDLGVEPGGFEKFFPMVVGFLVEFGWLAFARLIDGGIEAFRRKPEPLL